MIDGKLTNEELALIQKNVEYQTNYNLDEVIEKLKQKWDSDKYYYDEEGARHFYKFISFLELDKGKKGTKIKLLRFQFIVCKNKRKRL